jgi:predicted Zn-dependent protease
LARVGWISCFVVALVVCGWFALGARQAIDTSRAIAIIDHSSHVTAAQERRVRALVDGARPLNPDRQLDVILGQVAAERRDYSEARRVLEAVTRAEPQNIGAWVALAQAAGHDRSLFGRALAHVAVLEPRRPSS